MKRRIILAIGLMMVLTSCGEKQPVEDQQQATEVEQESTQDGQEGYIETEIGAFNGLLYSYNDGMLIYSTENGSGVLDSDGNTVLEPKYGYLEYGDGLFLQQANGDNSTIVWSYLDEEGKPFIEEVNGLKIIDGTVFKNGYAAVTLGDAEISKRSFGEYSTIIDKSGNIIIEAEGETNYLSIIEAENVVFEYNEDSEIVGAYNLDGTLASDDILLEENYNGDNIYEVDGLYIIKDVEDEINQSYALYDNVNKTEITGYDYLYYDPIKVGDNYIVDKPSENIGDYNFVIIDSQGNEILKLSETYNYFGYPFVYEDKIILSIEGGSIVLNPDGSVYKQTDFDTIYDSSAYGVGNKIGFTKDYEKVTEPIYDDFVPAEDNIAFGARDGKLYRIEIK